MKKEKHKEKYEKFSGNPKVAETMEIFTKAIQTMYEDDPKHTIKDPLEHILLSMGITPKKRDSEAAEEELREAKAERDLLQREISALEETRLELQTKLQTLQRQNNR